MRLIVRILDAEGALLGWAEAVGCLPGDGSVGLAQAVSVGLAVAGVPAAVNVHWPEVNVNATLAVEERTPREAGHVVTIDARPVMAFHSDEATLPAVTVGEHRAVSIPAGSLGANG